jgi:dTDP-4-dehydrorhamnose 3,5-epimerase
MNGDWERTRIDGVWRRRGVIVGDERGSFTELWRASLTAPIGDPAMVQANMSRSHAGVLRGMHLHVLQDDLWLLTEGSAVAATTDLRGALEGSTNGLTSQVLGMEPGDAVYIPAGVAHGFLALTAMTLVYLVSSEYDGSDEHGFAWNDTDAAIQWPVAPRIVSQRDRGNPTLRALVGRLRQEGQARSR